MTAVSHVCQTTCYITTVSETLYDVLKKCKAFSVPSLDAVNYTNSPTVRHDALAQLWII